MIAKRLTESRSLSGAGIAERRQFDCGQDFPLVYASSITTDSKAITPSSRHSSDYAFSRDLPRPFPGSRPPGHVIIVNNESIIPPTQSELAATVRKTAAPVVPTIPI